MATVADIGYRTFHPRLDAVSKLAGEDGQEGDYLQSPANYFTPDLEKARTVAAMTKGRGPQAIPVGSPGTFALPGGRIVPESYRPIAAAQMDYDPTGGISFAQHMAESGFPSGPVPTGTIIGGVPATDWRWETMSTPEMDIAAGGDRYYPELSMEENLAGMNPLMQEYFRTHPNAPAEYAADPFNFASDRGLITRTAPMHYDPSTGTLVPGALYR